MPERTNARERKRRQQRTADTRRKFLILGASVAGLGLLAAVGGVALNQAPSRGNPEPEIPRYLKDLDKKTKNRPEVLADEALNISQLSFDSFCQRLGYPTVDVRPIVEVYSSTPDFNRRRLELSGCSTLEGGEGTVTAETYEQHGKVVVGLNEIHSVAKRLKVGAASLVNEAMAHEPGHYFAKSRELTAEELAVFAQFEPPFPGRNFAVGLMVYAFEASDKQTTKLCRTGMKGRKLIEETTVQTEALEVIRDQGYFDYKSPTDPNQVNTYKSQIINRLFPEGTPPLFRLQQATDHVRYFEAIGQRLIRIDPSRNTYPHPAQVGLRYCIDTFGKFL